MTGYQFPVLTPPAPADQGTVYTVASGDLRTAANVAGWSTQVELERNFRQALEGLDRTVIRAHDADQDKGHGFIDSQRAGIDVFRTIPSLRVVPAGPYDYDVQSARGNTLGGTCVKYWLDGTPYESVFPGDVDRMIPSYQVGAIEVYNKYFTGDSTDLPIILLSAGPELAGSQAWQDGEMGISAFQRSNGEYLVSTVESGPLPHNIVFRYNP